jgi:hypothetical protein
MGVTPSGKGLRLDESGKFWTNGRTSGCFDQFWPNSLPVWLPGLSILPPLPGDEVRQAVRRASKAGVRGADVTSGATAADGREGCRPPSRVLSEPAVTMSPRELLTRSDPALASAAAGAHYDAPEGVSVARAAVRAVVVGVAQAPHPPHGCPHTRCCRLACTSPRQSFPPSQSRR